VLDYLTPAAQNVILRAAELARTRGDGELHAVHCLMAALDRPGPGLVEALEKAGADTVDINKLLSKKEAHFSGGTSELVVGDDVKAIISDAKKTDNDRVKAGTLLLSIWRHAYPVLGRHVDDLPRDPSEWTRHVADNEAEARWSTEDGAAGARTATDSTTSIAQKRKVLGRFDPLGGLLGQHGSDFSAQAETAHAPTGRDAEIRQILEVLAKKTHGNALLIGASGVGKTSILHGVARVLASDDAPTAVANTRLVALDPAKVYDAARSRSDAGDLLDRLASEAKEENAVFVVEEANRWVGVGGAPDQFDLASALRDVLESNRARALATVTPPQLRADLERAPAFLEVFVPIRLSEPDAPTMATILAEWSVGLSAHHGVVVPPALQAAAIRLASEHIRRPAEPARSLELLDRACAHAALTGRSELEESDVVSAVSAWSGLPVERLADQRTRLLGLEEALATEVMGQQQAIEKVCRTVRLTKQGVDWRPERPDGVFLFTGPTGVGKTALAIALARFLYGGLEHLIRLDMSEFRESHTVSKLIGSPAGYVGYGDETMLTSRILDRPSSLLLLDEVEKAHPDVVKVFLQVFDAGILTDAKGRRVSFSDVTVIMTSNVLIEKPRSMGFGAADEEIPEEDLRAGLKASFPPEFLNRIDEVVLFRQLEHDDFAEIVREKLLSQIESRYAEKGWGLSYTDAVVEFLVECGSSKKFGARHLERTFQKHVLLPMADAILSHVGEPGEVHLDVADDDIRIVTRQAE
jgi:ATP-dependent Clp protease ATP-binding subunit ClpC